MKLRHEALQHRVKRVAARLLAGRGLLKLDDEEFARTMDSRCETSWTLCGRKNEVPDGLSAVLDDPALEIGCEGRRKRGQHVRQRTANRIGE